MEFQARIEVFLELLSCAKPLFYWRYDGQGALLHSTCSSEKMLDAVTKKETITGEEFMEIYEKNDADAN